MRFEDGGRMFLLSGISLPFKNIFSHLQIRRHHIVCLSFYLLFDNTFALKPLRSGTNAPPLVLPAAISDKRWCIRTGERLCYQKAGKTTVQTASFVLASYLQMKNNSFFGKVI